MKNNYHSNHKNNEGHIKLGIMNLAQQNLYMLKRLTEKKSEYSVKKMEEDYKKIQNYKKIMCNFPCINFNKKRVFSSDHYNNKNEKKDYLPTINYINDGYLEKMKNKKRNKSKTEENLEKNKINDNTDNISNNNIINKKLDFNIKDKKDKKEEGELDKEKLINISRNETNEKDEYNVKNLI